MSKTINDFKTNRVPSTISVKKQPKTKGEFKNLFVRGILGLGLLMAVGSIAFCVVVIWGGTDSVIYKIASAPAAALGAFIAFVAFSKILK